MDGKPAPTPEDLPDPLATERDEGESFAEIVARHLVAEQVAEQRERDRARADWRAKHQREHDPESFGPFTIYPPDGIRTGWVITYRDSAVPGVYADRDTARFVCGYIFGGEQYGPVVDAWDFRACEYGRDVVSEDVFWLQENSEESDRLGIESQGTPPNLAGLEARPVDAAHGDGSDLREPS